MNNYNIIHCVWGIKGTMAVNILTHEMVPKHEVLSKEEQKAVLEHYNITKEKLPKITSGDPIIKAIKAKPGEIIKITRESPTAGETIYYRLVVGE